MLEFTSRRIVSPRIVVAMLMVGLAFSGWALVANPSIRPHVIVLGTVWSGALLLGWRWGGTFAKKIVIEEEQVRVVLQNGKERRFLKCDITEVELKSQLGFKGAIIRLNSGNFIRISDHMTGFADFLNELSAAHEHPVAPSHPSRVLYAYLVGFVLFAVASAVIGALQETPVSTAFYAASGMALLFVLILTWVLYVARRNVRGRGGQAGTAKSEGQKTQKQLS